MAIMKASAQRIKLKSMCGRIGQMGLGKIRYFLTFDWKDGTKLLKGKLFFFLNVSQFVCQLLCVALLVFSAC